MSVPTGVQEHVRANGTGTLEGARGSVHVSQEGVVLEGERDIFGREWDSAAMAALQAEQASWSDGTWHGVEWTGAGWTGNSWAGNSWAGNSWAGNSWAGQLLGRQLVGGQLVGGQLVGGQFLGLHRVGWGCVTVAAYRFPAVSQSEAAEPATPWRQERSLRIWGVIAALAVLAAGLVVTAFLHPVQPPHDRRISWVVLALLFALTEAVVLHVRSAARPAACR
jgi:hypothetical protein